jgi:hypothetical protein
MIDQILVMKRDSGIILYHENRTGRTSTTDPQLVAGFFAALTSFSEEVYGGHVQTLAIPGQNILFYGEEAEPILVLVCNELIAPEALHPLAQRLYHQFTEKYGAQIKKSPMRLQSFKAFHEDIEQELARFRPEKLLPTLIMETIPFLSYLQRMVKKGLERAMHAIITGLSPVACVGNIGQIRVAIDALKIFGMHRKGMIAAYERDPAAFELEQLDLVGVSPGFQEQLPPQYVTVDLRKGRVEGGSPNRYCKNLLAVIKNAEPAMQSKEIKKRLTALHHGVESLEGLLKARPKDPALKSWKEKWTDEERELMYDMLQAQFSVTRLLRELSKQLSPKAIGERNTQLIEIERRLFPVGELNEGQREDLAEQLEISARELMGERRFNAFRKRSNI